MHVLRRIWRWLRGRRVRPEDVQGMTVTRLPGLLELRGEALRRVAHNNVAGATRRAARSVRPAKRRQRDLDRELLERSKATVWWRAVMKG